MTDAESAPADSLEVRSRLVEALKLDLVGPWAGHELGAEQLPGRERPSNWYVAGFLIPTGTPPDRSGDADEDDDLDTVPESAGLAEESNDERKAARKAFFPSSIVLSFLGSGACRELAVTVRWGDYVPADIEEADGSKTPVWRRTPREAALSIPLGGDAGPVVRDVPDSGGLQLHVAERPLDAAGLAGAELSADTRSVSCFLVNRRTPDEAQPDRAYAFQAEIEVRSDEGFVPRPDLRGAHAGEWDDRVADLHYADTPKYATGHGGSAEWDLVDDECRSIRTAWIGTAEVEKTVTANVPGVEWSMDALGRLEDGSATQQALGPLVMQYREWIEARRQEVAADPGQGDRRDTAEQLLHYAGIAAERMERGVVLLGEDPDLLDAFRVANRAVACALRHRRREDRGVPGAGRRRDGAQAPAASGRRRAGRRRGQRHHALHAAVVDAGSACAGRRPDLRAGDRADASRQALWYVAVRDRVVGGEGGDTEHPGAEGGWPAGLGAREGHGVQAESRPEPIPNPARELPLVPDTLRARVVHVVAGRGSFRTSCI